MDPVTVALVALVLLVAGLAVGAVLGRAAAAGRALVSEAAAAELRTRLADAAAALEGSRRQVVALSEDRARLAAALEAERTAAAGRALEAERAREQLRAELERVGARVVEENGRALLERGREGLEALLGPLGARLVEFQARVERTYDVESRDRAALLGALDRLLGSEARLSAGADRLARALTGEAQVQGGWGELVLERALEAAGLAEGREFDLQVSGVTEDGARRRPDAVVHLPGDRAIVVDAKCSLTAFVEAAGAVDAAVREAALDAHVASVRGHVRDLAGKRYGEELGERTLDLVLMFVPSEPAFHAALARDPSLYAEAFRQRVVVCGPTTLLAALQLVGHLWRSERQHQNARRIGEEAGKLLEKFQGFVVDLDAVGARLDQAQESFRAARSKLADGRGNLLARARKVLELGAVVRSEKARTLLAGGGEGEGEGEGDDGSGGEGSEEGGEGAGAGAGAGAVAGASAGAGAGTGAGAGAGAGGVNGADGAM